MSENIKQLTEKEKVRKKISVWLGASNHIAVIHTVKELVGNSADEINKGNGDKIKITLHNDKTLTIEDNCQGLPIDGVNSEGVENYKLLFETLFAGTKYDNGINNSDYTVGVNGVFNTVLTFSAQDVTFEVSRPDKNIYSISYHKGENVKPLSIIGKSDNTYTKIKYTLDDDIYEGNYFTFEELCEIASQQASLINGSVEVFDEVNGVKELYSYEDTKEFLEYSTSDLEAIHETIHFSKNTSHNSKQNGENVVDDIQASISIKYTRQDEDCTQIEFLNGSNLIHHGTIFDGLVNGLRSILNKYIRDNGMYKKNEKQITREDVLLGLNYVIDFKSYFPVFANQTKFASYVKYYESVMRDILDNFFASYSIENKSEMDLIAKHVLVSKKVREHSEKTRLDIKKKLSGTVNNLSNRVDGFVNCKSKDNTKTELYLVEGKSALGSTKMGRDEKIQAIYALRGKILNCLKADYDKIFKNDIIVDMIRLFGCGVEVKSKHAKDLHTFDKNNLRWSKIVITTDADVDGFHIRTLILTLIHRLMPTLIEDGCVYIVESPLYEIEQNDVSVFAYSDKEKDLIVSKMKGSFTVQRSKGLGENTAEMMWETTMNPETRKLIQVVPEDVEKTVKAFNMFLGDNLEERKQFIEDNLHEYLKESLD